MPNKHSTSLIILIVLLGLTSLVALTWANYSFAKQNPGGNDFLARWMGARYWLQAGVSPYSPVVSVATQKAIYGHIADPAQGEDVAHFAYPLNSMIFFAPFALLDFLPARAIWMTFLELSLALLALVSTRLVGWKVSPWKAAVLVLFALVWYHGVRTIIIGQFAAINALLIVAALYLIIAGQDIAAGILLALSTAKPQMVFLIIPFVLIWAIAMKRRDLIWSIVLGLLVLIGVSLILLPSWPLQMFAQMLEYPEYTNIGSPLSIIASFMIGFEGPLNLALHVIAVAYLLIEWIIACRKTEHWFFWAAMMTLVVTNLVAFRTATTNYVMLLPVLFIIFKAIEERWKDGGRILVLFLMFLLVVGLWALFIVTVQGNVEQAVMYLPLPFFCLVGLWYARQWVLNPRQLELKDLVHQGDM